MNKKNKFNYLLLPLILLIFSCKHDKSIFSVDNLNNGKVECFGHGGMGIQWKFPIDSKPSLQEVLSFNADGTEMDVQMTKDSILVFYHDADLQSSTLCNGVINDKTWNEIVNDNCRFNSPLSTTLNITSADDFFASVTNRSQFIFTFDTKLYNSQLDYNNYLATFARAVKRLVRKYNLEKNLFVEVQDEQLLNYLQSTIPELHYFFYASFDKAFQIAKQYHLHGITINFEDISSAQVDSLHAHNIHVTLFNMQSENDNLLALRKNPDYLQSDKINHLLSLMKE
ncbi:MAG: hypothetical protein RL065_1947 [Bacteroidota bacterium]|jgi:glycerophosphoryl diester phosphodiesterase